MKDYSHIKHTLRSDAVDSKAIENRLTVGQKTAPT